MIAPKETHGITRVLRLAWPDRTIIGLGLVFLVIGSAMLLAYPQAVKVIIDEALGSGGASKIDNAVLVILAVFIKFLARKPRCLQHRRMNGRRINLAIQLTLFRGVTYG